jgi:hypothetical protein
MEGRMTELIPALTGIAVALASFALLRTVLRNRLEPP